MSLSREKPLCFQLTAPEALHYVPRVPGLLWLQLRTLAQFNWEPHALSRTRVLPLDHRVRTDRADHKSWAPRERGTTLLSRDVLRVTWPAQLAREQGVHLISLHHWPRVWGAQPAPSLSHHTRNCNVIIPHQNVLAIKQPATSRAPAAITISCSMLGDLWPTLCTRSPVTPLET